MGSTNYYDTFIAMSTDCPVAAAEEPPLDAAKPTVAALQYEMLAAHPYEYTSDDILFAVHARRSGIPRERLEDERARFFSKGQPCLRASPLGKRYGWGTHHDAQGRVALVPMESVEAAQLMSDPSITQKTAMRSSRAT